MESKDVVQHSSSAFANLLKSVRGDALEMGGLVEQHARQAVQAFVEGNQKIAKKISREDYKINAMEIRIDEECNEFLALHHPVAMDLRTVVAVIKTTCDLERVGDEAEKIARLATHIDHSALRKRHLRTLKHLGPLVLDILSKALDSFARLDTDLALEVLKKDSEVDQENEACIRQMITFMMEKPNDIQLVLNVLWCAKALERIGDHAANICEHVLYQVLGKDLRHVSIEQVERELADAPVQVQI